MYYITNLNLIGRTVHSISYWSMVYNYVHYGHEAGATELSEQKRSPLVLPRIPTQPDPV